jgi:hypothetical protein
MPSEFCEEIAGKTATITDARRVEMYVMEIL